MSRSKYILLIVATVVAWAALVLQAYLSFSGMLAKGLSFSDAFIRFFSYFTILTNTLIAVDCSYVIFASKSRWSKSPAHASFEGCLAVSIFFVSVGYTVLLRSLLHLSGMALFANSLLHYVVPVLFLLLWFLFAPSHQLTWKQALWWILYPLVYFLYALIQGWRTGLYPYPFIDASRLGYPGALFNGAVLLICFWLTSILFIYLHRRLHRMPVSL